MDLPGPDLLDVLLAITLVVSATAGWRLGLLARAASWLGLAAGFLLATVTVPWAVRTIELGVPTSRLLVGLVTLAVTVMAVSGVAQAIGLRMRGRVRETPLRLLDHWGGLAAGLAGLIVAIWFLAPAAAGVPGLSRQVRGSAVIGAIRSLTPEPPDPVRALRSLMDDSRFPEVFDDLRPAPDTGPPPSELAVAPEVVERVTASTANVETEGCGARYEGSAFAVADETMVTNAHVVAGADVVRVRRPDGEVLDATVVVFDDDRDLAVLQVPGLGQQPLALAQAEEGADAVVIGYPGGQDTPRTQPAVVQQERLAIGRDIYDRDVTEREVLFLSTRLRQGDSGAPVVGVDGQAYGAVFAISPDRDTTAYALDVDEVRAVLEAPRAPGETGRCQ
jgi:S1-C subfamily serine protease